MPASMDNIVRVLYYPCCKLARFNTASHHDMSNTLFFIVTAGCVHGHVLRPSSNCFSGLVAAEAYMKN